MADGLKTQSLGAANYGFNVQQLLAIRQGSTLQIMNFMRMARMRMMTEVMKSSHVRRMARMRIMIERRNLSNFEKNGENQSHGKTEEVELFEKNSR